jgi:hypothetical protein
MSQQCRSCGAEVIFVPSAKTGKTMILDAKPEKRIVLTDGEAGGGLFVGLKHSDYTGGQARAYVADVYVDHHATCPQAAQWKGRTRAGAP